MGIRLAFTVVLASLAFGKADLVPPPGEGSVRVAQFNIQELSRGKLSAVDDKGRGLQIQLRAAAETIQRVRPDVLVINEIDYHADQSAVGLFQKRYLDHGWNGAKPIQYEYVFYAPVNTGVPTPHDFNNNNRTGDWADAYGFGKYPGQYGMAVLSRFPIDSEAARTFRKFLWKDMPDNNMPNGKNGKPDWLNDKEVADFRLSSKSHWDVPVELPGGTAHLLVSHPTPPVFDGPEDLNGRRNFDEIRLWADYISGGSQAAYIVDDQSRRGGLDSDAPFIVLGDLNADPALDDEHPYGPPPIAQLTRHPRVQDPKPESRGAAVYKSDRDYKGPKALRTAEFGRADYVLPSVDLEVTASGVFWPPPDSELADLVTGDHAASDHRLVWVDLKLKAPTKAEQAAKKPGKAPQ